MNSLIIGRIVYLIFHFYGAMLCRARWCHSTSSIRNRFQSHIYCSDS